MNLIDRAKLFAFLAHAHIGQKRKYSGEMYFVHLEEVAKIVASVTDDEETIAAAFLHDVMEDVAPLAPNIYNYAMLLNWFGSNVTLWVSDLTDEYTSEKYPKLNRAERKSRERQKWFYKSSESKTVKLADLISNTKDIVQNDPNFAKTYVKEKILLLPYLQGGHPVLMAMAVEQVREAMSILDLYIKKV